MTWGSGRNKMKKLVYLAWLSIVVLSVNAASEPPARFELKPAVRWMAGCYNIPCFIWEK